MRPWSEVARAVNAALQDGDFERAHELMDPYEALADQTDHTELAGKVAFYRGIAFDKAERFDDALRAFREAMDFDIEAFGEESTAVAHCLSSLALVYTRARRPREAADQYIACAELFRALGDAREADGCTVQACQRLIEAEDFEGVLDFDGVITRDSEPTYQVSWLIMKSEAWRRTKESDAKLRTENMHFALEAASDATRITEPASAALQEALRRAWVNYGVMELCFRDVEVAGLSYSMALDFARTKAERDVVARSAASYAQDGIDVRLTKLDPEAFILARTWSGYVTVLHRDHGVRVIVGETTARVGEAIEVTVTDAGYALS
jgi:tetratricopeptide (TPR) repeat protein